MIRDTHTEWTYRDVTCRVYERQTPTTTEWDGYAKIGDEWEQFVTATEATEEEAREKLERAVDAAIMRALDEGSDDDDEWYEPFISSDDIEPVNPHPYPSDPPSNPHDDGPIWRGDQTYTIGWSTDETKTASTLNW